MKLDTLMEAKLNYATIKAALEKIGVIASVGCIAAFFEGGDAQGFGKFMDDIVKAGYDDAATTFDENKIFWKKIGVTKAQYNKACKDSL